MTKKDVEHTLDNYKENKARLEFLQMEAEELRRGISIENRPEVHAIGAQTYDHIHTKVKKDSIVETLGLRSLDGETYADADRWQRELDALEREIRTKERAVRYVDIWLSALDDSEKIAVEWHYIDHKTWERVSLATDRLLGYYIGAEGMRRIGREAIRKICSITERS